MTHFSNPYPFLSKLLLTGTICLLLQSPGYALWPFSKENQKSEISSPQKQSPPAVTEAATPLSAPPATREGLSNSFAPVVEKAASGVVNIQTISRGSSRAPGRRAPSMDEEFLRRFFGEPPSGGRRINSLGSGVIVSSDGYILTNNHVIDGADEIKVTLKDDKREYSAKLVGTDPRTDIALLKIDAKDLPAIHFGDSDALRVGDIVLAIGNPFGLGQTVTMGIVSAVGRSGIGVSDLENFIQTDASINQGNSGGALVNARGELIGINNAIFSQSGGNIGIGFAVPVSMAKHIMEQLIKDGKVIRGYLGVLIQPVNASIAKVFNLPDNSGALVSDVTAGSGAEAAGIKRGDVIIELDGQKIRDDRHLRLLVSQGAPGKRVSVKAVRDGKPRVFNVTLKVLPETRGTPGSATPELKIQNLFEGVEIADIDAETRSQLKIPPAVTGVYVKNVNPDTPAAEAGLRAGSIIQEINRKKITDTSTAFAQKKADKDNSFVLSVWSEGITRFIVINE